MAQGLHVAQGFAAACAELVAASDKEGKEGMFLIFGKRATSQTPAFATHLVLVDHYAFEGSCGVTVSGAKTVTKWKEETQTCARHLGWVHSHHSLPQQPSAADPKTAGRPPERVAQYLHGRLEGRLLCAGLANPSGDLARPPNPGRGLELPSH